MDPLTPKKPRSMPPLGDNEATSINVPVAPWDPAAEPSGPDTRATQETSAITLRDYDLAPGTRLGEYQLEQKIGQGGMGVVYLAVHPLIGKRAAIKVLKRELCADVGTLERFVDEARVVNQIGHPNIVDVFAFGEMPDGRSYFVMEYLKGETLRERIARSRLSLDEVRSIVKPLARALQAAHDKGIIHRDLKPDNVFLVEVPDEQPKVKLLDFGIAKLARNEHRVEKTATGAIVGTPQYIAPEQAKGYTIDPRADIYALGALLFELLTGRPPFMADNAMEMVAKHLMEAPVRPSTLIHAISSELDELVLRMLAKTPDGRPTLGEVVAVIERSRVSATTLPIDRMTPLPQRNDSTPVPAVNTPVPVRARTDVSKVGVPFEQSDESADWQPPSRPKWVIPAILGVPLVGVLAFLLVSNLGSKTPAPPRTEIVAPSPEVSPPPAPPVHEATVPKSDQTQGGGVVDPVTPPAPPTQPAPIAKTGALRVDVANPGVDATILVDGQPYTADMQLSYGAHTIEVRAKGMQPQLLDIDVTGPTTKRISLVANPKDAVPAKKDPTPTKKDPVKKDVPAKKDPVKKDPTPKKDEFAIPDGDGLAPTRR